MKLKSIFVVSVAFALTACAYTPTEVINQNSRFDFTSFNKPTYVANCIAKNADELDPTLQGLARGGEYAGQYEVVVRMLGSSVSTAIVFKITPVGKGSAITSYVSKNVFINHKTFAQKILGSC